MKKLIGNFSSTDLIVRKSNSKFKLSKTLNNIVTNNWDEFIKINTNKQNVWNGSVYRLADIKLTNSIRTMIVNVIDYKTHYCTKFILEHLSKLPFQKRPNGIFVVSFLLTSDNKFVFSKRSGTTTIESEINLLGGSLSPDDICVDKIEDIFSFFKIEFNEEIGLSTNIIDSMSGIGMYNTDYYRIGIVLYTKINVSSDYFLKNSKPNFEHKKLIVVKSIKMNEFLKRPSINKLITYSYNDLLTNS